MPIAVTKYRCQFKCGTKAKSSEKDALKHEAKCYKNPDNKTCNTCSNQIYERYEDCYGRGCKVEFINNFLDELQEKLTVTGAYVKHVKPLFNCPNWNNPDLQPATDQFLLDIRPKIELAAMYRKMAEDNARKDNVDSLDGLPF